MRLSIRTATSLGRACAISITTVVFAVGSVRAQSSPPLTVPEPELAAALSCPVAFTHADHPPVLLVHGTAITPEQSWAWNYAKVLPGLGYDVCTVRLPDHALGDIQVASDYVVFAVRTMAAASNRRIAVIGHSQGGLEPRWALRWWPDLRSLVDDYVGLASPNHGIYAADACAQSGNCWPAVWQMAENSHFLAVLNSVDEAAVPVSYTNVYSLTDELVQPEVPTPTSALRAATNVTNLAIQDVCPGRPVHHVGLLADAVTFAIVMDALDHEGPADPSRLAASICTQTLMPGVTAADVAAGNLMVYGDGAIAFSEHSGTPAEPPVAPYASE